MSQRRVPEGEKAVTWSLSAPPSLQKLAAEVAKEEGMSESAYVRQLVIRDLKRRRKL